MRINKILVFKNNKKWLLLFLHNNKLLTYKSNQHIGYFKNHSQFSKSGNVRGCSTHPYNCFKGFNNSFNDIIKGNKTEIPSAEIQDYFTEVVSRINKNHNSYKHSNAYRIKNNNHIINLNSYIGRNIRLSKVGKKGNLLSFLKSILGRFEEIKVK